MVNWKKVLIEIYNKAPDMYGFNSNVGNQELERKTGMNKNKLDNCIKLLTKIGLIKKWGIGPKTKITGNVNPQTIKLPIELTTKGFNVTLDLEKHKDSAKLQFGLLVFSAIIVTTGAFGFINEIFTTNPLTLLAIYLGIVILMGIVGIVGIIVL